MKSKMLPFVILAGVLAAFLFASSCGNGSSVCPTCGTDKKATVGLINIMLVPEHNGNGEPGGPFNIFDISWVDPVNHLYYVTDRVGLDVPVFSTATDIAISAIGGDNSIAEAGNNVSPCFNDATGTQIIPPITTAQGNFTRFGCKTMNFRLPGFFGPNGHYGGFLGGQCCASRSNNLNPLTGPNGLEASSDGTVLFVGNGSSHVAVFDMTATLATNGSTSPTVIATLVSGTSPDYDGPNGIGPCQASANGRAFSDPTCGDLRGDELATTGATPAVDPNGNKHDLLFVINGDPGLPFFTIFDVTNVIHKTGTVSQQHCLPSSPTSPYSPGIVTLPSGGPSSTFPANFATCILGQVYYDNALPTSNSVVVDETNGFACPDPSLEFSFPPGGTRVSVPSGASGDPTGLNTTTIPCHHGPMLRNGPPGTPTNGTFCPTATSFPDCFGAVALAGLGGMVYNPNTGHFLLTNANATTDITVGSVDEIDPFHPVTTAAGTVFVPAVINSFPTPSCMPSGIAMGPGTDALVTCAGHDGRQFAPTTYIINGTTGVILATINNIGGVDQGWFNPGDNRYYLAARDMPTGPVLGVIDAVGRQWLQNVPTQGNSHSVAADPTFNKIYVPLPAGALCSTQQIDGCVGVYARQ
jgi:hypothetical protein